MPLFFSVDPCSSDCSIVWLTPYDDVTDECMAELEDSLEETDDFDILIDDDLEDIDDEDDDGDDDDDEDM